MHNAVAAHLAAWESFYIIVGSSAGALTGLQFVVIALITEVGAPSGRHEVSAFGTPTVIHFCAVLLLGAILSAPWGALANVAFALGLTGLAGVAYTAIVIKRAWLQPRYKPDLGDWTWHTVLPLLSYTALLAAAIALPRSPAPALFVIGAAALTLLFVGIHNAWDTVTYVVTGKWEASKPEEKRAKPSPEPAEG
jgi:hypothetical protein